MIMSRQVTCTHSKQGRARGQRARAANKGKGVAHRLVAGAWLAEEHYAHVAEDGHEELGPGFEQRRGIDLYGPPKHTQAKVGCAGPLQRCVAPRRSALSLSLLPASSKLHPRTIMYICSQRLGMVVRGPNKSTSQPRHSVSARSVQWRAAPPRGQFVFSTSAIRCDPHQWWETALTSALLRAAKRALTRRRGPERLLRARVQCPWQCWQPGAPPLSAVPVAPFCSS